jgi:hypothetical protein
MVFQNCTNVKEEVEDPCDETYTPSWDPSHSVYIKVEEVSDAEEEVVPEEVSDAEEEVGPEEVPGAEEEEIPMPIALQEIKAEPEVRCMSLYVHCKK